MNTVLLCVVLCYEIDPGAFMWCICPFQRRLAWLSQCQPQLQKNMKSIRNVHQHSTGTNHNEVQNACIIPGMCSICLFDIHCRIESQVHTVVTKILFAASHQYKTSMLVCACLGYPTTLLYTEPHDADISLWHGSEIEPSNGTLSMHVFDRAVVYLPSCSLWHTPM